MGTGSVGVGTVLYAAAIGPLTHLTIPRLTPAGRPAEVAVEV